MTGIENNRPDPDEINSASVRLNRLIENLLNMSQLESGRISPRPDWCDVHELSNQVIHSLKQEQEHFLLSIVKGFTEAQGGTVTAENRNNGGAIIPVSIPSPGMLLEEEKQLEVK